MLLTEQEVRQRLLRETRNRGLGNTPNSTQTASMASKILESTNTFQKSNAGQIKTYDIFLSHSTKDKELVAGTKLILEDLGFSVYVDWIEDPQLNRSNVTKETAEILQKRMQNCKSLFYAFSTNSNESRWMPWECGYFDGIKNGKVAVLPISNSGGSSFKGTEYLGLYYYITIQPSQVGSIRIFIRESNDIYIVYEDWMEGRKPYKR